jgi:hypothetical protein
MKSAYELALERMEKDGVARPETLPLEIREKMAEIRRVSGAKLAELEILHKDKMANLTDYTKRAEQDDYFRRERQRIEEDRDRKVEKLRG